MTFFTKPHNRFHRAAVGLDTLKRTRCSGLGSATVDGSGVGVSKKASVWPDGSVPTICPLLFMPSALINVQPKLVAILERVAKIEPEVLLHYTHGKPVERRLSKSQVVGRKPSRRKCPRNRPSRRSKDSFCCRSTIGTR